MRQLKEELLIIVGRDEKNKDDNLTNNNGKYIKASRN
jgi:hypothetical protein